MKNKSRNNEFGSTKKSEGAKSFEKLFIQLLKGIYDSEKALLTALPKLKQATTTDELQEAFEDHELTTRKQVHRLDKIFRYMNVEYKGEKCEIIEMYSKVAEKIIKSTEDDSMVRDAGLIVVAQQVEHYEIATYGGLIQFALALGEDKVSDLLESSLMEEEETDDLLTEIAECCINMEAAEEDEVNSNEASDDENDEEKEDNATKTDSKSKREKKENNTKSDLDSDSNLNNPIGSSTVNKKSTNTSK